MKTKNKANKISTFFLITAMILCSSVFTSCFNAVFYNIRQDVSPEDSTVKGMINSICRYSIDDEEYLFLAAEKGLRYKSASTGNVRNNSNSSWETYQYLPFQNHKYLYYGFTGSSHEGETILKVLADKDTLYLITVDYSQEITDGYSKPDHIHIWAKQFKTKAELSSKGDEWTEIKFAESADEQRDNFFPYTYESVKDVYFSNFNMFSTNAPKKEHRRVFVRCSNRRYYELKGLEKEDITSSVFAQDYKLVYADYDDSESEEPKNVRADIDSAAYLGETLYFFDSMAVTTNETFEKNATFIYFARSERTERNESSSLYEPIHFTTEELNYIYEKNIEVDGKQTSKLVCKTIISDAGEPISCLSVTKDALLIGRGDFTITTTTYGGITKVSLDEDGNAGSELLSFDTNASIQILTLLAVDPAKTEKENIIYSSIVFKGSGSSSGTSFDNIGLWAYYPDRGNWNCE